MKIKGAFPVRWAAKDGDPGTGVTILQTTTKYAKSTSGTTRPTTGWQTSVPSVPDGQYLWTWVYVRYSDGTETNAYSVARMGIDGRGIQSSTVTYSQQATSVDPSTITNWGAFPSTLTDGYWLYTKTHIVYSDNESTDSYSVSQVGVGSYYAGCQEYWAIGDSDTTPPEGAPTAGTYVNGQTINTTWSQDRVQTTAANPYLWNFEISADSRGNRYVTQAICIGNFAKGISSIVETYAISAYGTAGDGRSYPSDIAAGDWTDEQNAAAPTEAKRYQWNRTVVTYNNNDTDTHYHVSAVKGIDGKGAVYIDLDNENDSMLFDGQGNSIVGSVTSNISLYANGAKVAPPPTFSVQSKSSFLSASISNGVLTVSTNGFYASSASAGYVIVQCTYNSVVYTARMTVKKLVGTDKYEIALNHNAVSYNETEGTLSNASFTINIYRTAQNGTRTRVGDSSTTMAGLGLTAKVYPNGYSTDDETIEFNAYNVGSYTLTAANAAEWNNFAIVLFKNNVEIDRETVPINKAKNGNTGPGAVILDLDNENDSMLYDGAGTLKSGNVTSQARLLVGGVDKTSEVSEWDCVDKSNVTASISNSGKITVTAMSGTSGSCRAKAKYGSEYYYATLTVKKLVGVDKYELVVSPNAFTYNTTKAENAQQTANIKVYRTGQNGARTLVASLTTYSLSLKYYYQPNNGNWSAAQNIVDGTDSGKYNSGVDRTIYANSNQSYRFELLDSSGNVLDVETVPVSKTTDGGKGDDSIIVDLDNENDSILYDGADSPISDPVVSNGSLYKGPEKQTSGITWSIASAEGVTLQNSGVATANTYARSSYPTAAWITSGGVVTVNGLTSSQAKIVVRATYNSKTYDKTLTIKKLRGVDKYDLVISPAALTYNSSTALTNGVSKATVEVRIWRTAQNGTRTLIDDFNGANKYGLSLEVTPNITEYSTQTYGASFLVGSAISSANNTIAVVLKKGAQVLDSENIPIAKTTNGSGSAGPAAKSIYAKSFDKPATPTGATPWTASGSIWSETASEDNPLKVEVQGDWYKDEDGYWRSPAIGSSQTSIATLMFVTTEANQVVYLRAKCSTYSSTYMYIGNVDSAAPTSSYQRRISGSNQDTGDIAITVANAGVHFICIAYVRYYSNSSSDLYAKFIVGPRFVWRSDAKTYNTSGAVATWNTPVKVSGEGSEQAAQMRGNILQQTAFLASRMDKWDIKNGSTTDGLDGRNGYKGVPEYTNNYKELLAQSVYDPNGDKPLLANTWYTLSFWAKADPYIQIDKYLTSYNYGFGQETVYLEGGVQCTLWVNGYRSSAASSGSKTLRVYIYLSDWSWSTYVEITATSSTTKSVTFTPPSTGEYKISSYSYPSGATSSQTVTVNWYRIDRGMRMVSYLYPTSGTQSTYTAIDVSAGRIKDGQVLSNNSSPTDNNCEWQLTEVWTRHTLTFKTRSSIPSAIQRLLFRMHQASNGVYVCMPKLEQGTVATAYCTNDNDIADMAADETGFPNDRLIWSESPSEPYVWNDTRRDFVAYEISGEWRKFFVKRKGMTVPNGVAPTAGGNTYWEQGNVVSTLLSNTIIGTNCSIGGFLASAQVFKSQNERLVLNGVLGIIQMFHSDGYSWQVLEDGRQVLGVYTDDNDKNEHIQLDPSAKEIRIYDTSGSCVTTLNGTTYSALSDIFGGSTGNLTLNSTYKSGSASASNGGSKTVDNVTAPPAPRQVSLFPASGVTTALPACRLKINGSLSATGSRTWVQMGSGSSSQQEMRPIPSQSVVDDEGRYSIDNWARVTVMVKTYSNSSRTTLIKTTQVAVANSQSSSSGYGTKSVSMNNLAVDLPAGFHTLMVDYYGIVYGGQTSTTSVSLSWNITSASYVSDIYLSRLFANGAAYGSSLNNFFAAMNIANKMLVKAQTLSSGNVLNGFELSATGLSIIHAEKLLRPVVTLGWGRVTCTHSGSTYTDTLASFENGVRSSSANPSVSRQTYNDRGGIHRITYPADWTNLGLAASRIMVNAVAYYDAKDHNYICSVRTITATYCEIVIGDDTSPNDDMNFYFEIKYMLP